MHRLFFVLVGSGWALAGTCTNTSLSSRFEIAQSVGISPICVGPWSAIMPKTIDFLTVFSGYAPLACAQSSCRQDFQTSASNIGAIVCDEAQAAAKAMTGLVNLCSSLVLATTAQPTCSNYSYATNLGAVPAACASAAPLATSALAILQSSDLKSFDAVCQVPACVANLTARITALPTCRLEWPYFYGAPLIPKEVYLGYLSSFCDNLPTQSAVNTSSCPAKLAALYATPFSDTCIAQYFGNRIAFVIYEATLRRYILLSRYLATSNACKSSIQYMLNDLADAGPCAASVLFAFQTLQQAVSKVYPSNSSLALCTNSESASVIALLGSPASVACLRNPLVQIWSDVYTPHQLADLASIVATPGCVASAVAFATSSFPKCEFAAPDKGDAAVGMDAATRFTSFLLAADYLVTREASPPVSRACFDGGHGSYWLEDARPMDFLTVSRGLVPMACTVDSCRADFIASAIALKETNASTVQSLGASVAGIANVCNSLALSFGLPRCTSASPFDLGGVPPACTTVAASVASAAAIALPSDLGALTAVCQVPACVAALTMQMNALPDCEAEWGPSGGAFVSPKQVYLSYLTSFCNSTTVVVATNFSTCSNKLAAAHFVTFTNDCVESILEYQNGFGSVGEYGMVIRQVTINKYIPFSRFLATSPTCTANVNATANLLNNVGPCGTPLAIAFKVLLQVISTKTPSNRSLALCSSAQTNALTTLLSAAAAVECSRSNPWVQRWSDVFAPRHLADMVTTVAAPGCVTAAVAYAKTAFPACEYVDVEFDERAVGVSAATYFTTFLIATQSFVPETSVTAAPSTSATTTTPSSTSLTSPTPTRATARSVSVEMPVVGLCIVLYWYSLRHY